MPGVEVLYTRTECLLELMNRALGHSVDPIGHHLAGIYTLWPPGLTRFLEHIAAGRLGKLLECALLNAVNLEDIDTYFARWRKQICH